MAVVSLICAPSEQKRAAEIARRLEASGRQVRIATQKVDYFDPDGPTIVLWSPACVDWGPAKIMARDAATSGSLIPVSLEPCDPPIRIALSPIDLSKWRGEASLTWRTLIERIERVEHRTETRAPRHHFLPMLAMAATGLMVVGFASMLRTEDGAGRGNTAVASQEADAPQQRIAEDAKALGGPDFLTDTLELDVEVELISAPERIGRAPRVAPLPALAEPLPLAEVAIRRDGILVQILRPARDLLREVASEL